jgi:hypothetical protein
MVLWAWFGDELLLAGEGIPMGLGISESTVNLSSVVGSVDADYFIRSVDSEGNPLDPVFASSRGSAIYCQQTVTLQ